MITTEKLNKTNPNVTYVPGKYYVMLQVLFRKENIAYKRMPRAIIDGNQLKRCMEKYLELTHIVSERAMIPIETQFSSEDIFKLCSQYEKDKEMQDLVKSQTTLISDSDDIPWGD